jgi:hypothetical protein
MFTRNYMLVSATDGNPGNNGSEGGNAFGSLGGSIFLPGGSAGVNVWAGPLGIGAHAGLGGGLS